MAGKIVACLDKDPTVPRRVKKMVAEGAGASGLILIDETEKGVSFDSGSFPFSEVGKRAGTQILKYINSSRCGKTGKNRNLPFGETRIFISCYRSFSLRFPAASILLTTDVNLLKPAPVVAYFSSRGPSSLTESILKVHSPHPHSLFVQF